MYIHVHVYMYVYCQNTSKNVIVYYVKGVLSNYSMTLFTDAAEVLRQNRRLFEQNVAKSMRGGYVGSVYFERCLVK